MEFENTEDLFKKINDSIASGNGNDSYGKLAAETAVKGKNSNT